MSMVQDILSPATLPPMLDANGITEETVPYEHAEAYLQSPEAQAKSGPTPPRSASRLPPL